jgi:hypothetical protein
MASKKDKAEVAVYNPEEIGAEVVPETAHVEMVSVVFNTNVKHNETRYVVGEKVEVSQEDYEIFLKAGVIDGDDA